MTQSSKARVARRQSLLGSTASESVLVVADRVPLHGVASVEEAAQRSLDASIDYRLRLAYLAKANVAPRSNQLTEEEAQRRHDLWRCEEFVVAAIERGYLATANAEGQPYAQHRGGPKGFIRVIDERTIGFADYVGNRQYVTAGNLSENDKAFLFLMDYAHRRRVKVWGHARVVRDDAELIARLMPDDYRARPEQAILFEVAAWDVNCPQHIPQKFGAEDVAAALAQLEERNKFLEIENDALRRQLVNAANAE